MNFFDIPPLLESFAEFQECEEKFLGFYKNKELIGAVSYITEKCQLTLCRMVVHPNHFRKGVAQCLLETLVIEESHVTTLKVSTGKANTPAFQLYLKNGFKFIGSQEVSPDIYICYFEKTLKDA